MLIIVYSICGVVTISCLIGIIVLLVFWRSHSNSRYAKKNIAPKSYDTSSIDYEKLLSALMEHMKDNSAPKSSNISTIDYEELLSEYMASKYVSIEQYDTRIANLKSLEKEALRQAFASIVQDAEEKKQKQQSEQNNPIVTG